ncbi:hypothetical protein Aperf_G00000083810 [Anoplocephala perfoliata]
MARCAVIGGGISGLSTAYLLSRLPKTCASHISLFETNSSHFGGCFLTHRNPITGALHDLGPHSARIAAPSSSPLLRVVSSLDFARDEVFWMPALSRFLYAGGALRPINLFSPLAEPPFTRSHLFLFIRRALSKRPGPFKRDISVDEFLRTRLDDEFADYLGNALMRGICGVDSKQVSASAFLGQLIKWEQEAPNLILGAAKNIALGKVRSLYPAKKGVAPGVLDDLLPPLKVDFIPPKNANILNFSQGMQVLTDRLYENLKAKENVTLNKNATVRSLDYKDNKYTLSILGSNSSQTVETDAVFICTPVQQMDVTRLLSAKTFPSASVAVVAFEFDIQNPKLPRGFGHLLPQCEDETVMGIIYDSYCSPQMDGQIESRKTTRFTVMLSPRKEWLETAPGESSFALESSLRKELVEVGASALKKQLKLEVEKLNSAYAGIWRNTIPTYPVGHLENKVKIRKAIGDRLGAGSKLTLHLVGSALDGVGVGDCVRSAVNAVDGFRKQIVS